MSYRTAQVYVQASTMKRLRLVKHIYPQEASLDELVDQLVNIKIDETYPLVAELEKELDKTQKAFIAQHKGTQHD